MGVEVATYISELDDTFPLGGDPISAGDNHLRLIKTVLQSQFPNLTAAALNATVAEFNSIIGLATEFGLISGLSADATELNILDGATISTAEINRLGSIAGNGALDAFPTGTLMLFQQTAAPTGWTKQTSHDDKALRVISGTVGSGGTDPFSTVFGLQAVDDHTLSTAQMPSHTHGNSGGHDHNVDYRTGSGKGATQISGTTDFGATNQSKTTSGSGNHTHNSNGSSDPHAHNIELRVQYVDLIIASKN